MKKIFCLLLLLAANCFALEFSDADIVLPPKASVYLKFAAKELSSHLKMITGGKFNITTAPKSKVKIMLGKFPAGFNKKTVSGRDAFAIIARGNTLYIAGHDTYTVNDENVYTMITHDRASKGTLAGVHSFLEDHGVRWLAPGSKKNTFVYRKKTIKVPEGQKIFTPAVEGRCIAELYNFGEAFMKKDGPEYIGREPFGGHLWALRHRYNRFTVSQAHSESRLQLGKLWPKNPERFQLMANGQRNTRYLCWTDPAVPEIWKKAADAYFSGKTPAAAGLRYTPNWRGLGIYNETFSIDPMDHGAGNDGRCRCKRCQAFRKKHSCADDSEIIWQVIVKVARMVKAKYPGKYVTTLVYPPKQQVPKTVKLPDNLRVVICLPGPKKINDAKSMKFQLDTIRTWSRIVGKENVGLWLYQCELFGGKLPGVPEWYPEYFQRYIKLVKPYVRSIFHEYHSHNYTYRVLESYLQTHILWDPDVDVKKLKAEHIRLYYGPAAPFMSQVIARMEENWRRYEQMTKNMPDPSTQIGVYRDFKPIKKLVWGRIYNKKEMAYFDSLLKRAEKAAGKSIYGERLERFRRLVFDYMEKERSEVMDLADRAPEITISAAPWAKQKSRPLVSAHRDGTKLTSSVRCMFRFDKGVLQVRVIADEPKADAVMISKKLKNGSPEIWKDWALELFLYTPADKTIRQYIVNAANVISCMTLSSMKKTWSAPAGVKSLLTRNKNQFVWELSIPAAVLGGNLKGLKLNVAHERNLRKISPQFATFSPAALLGNWHNTDAYARVRFSEK